MLGAFQCPNACLTTVFRNRWCLRRGRRETDGRERDPAFVSDAYAECYPAYHDYARAVVDSDDEADFSHMDGKAGSGRSRTDFATDEEWQVRVTGGELKKAQENSRM